MAKHLLPLGVTGVMLPELDFDQQLAACQEAGVTHYSVRPRIIPDAQRDKPWGNWGNHKFDLTPQRLLDEADQIKKKLDDAGLTVCGTVPHLPVDADEETLKLHFEGASKIGARCIRVQPRGYPGDEWFDYQKLVDVTVEQFRRACDIAKPYRLKLVIETHRRTHVCSPSLAMNVCRHFDPAELGVIFDIANYSGEGEVNPNLAVAVLGDYIDHAHVGGGRRVSAGYDEIGFRKATHVMTKMDEGDLYIPDWLAALARLNRPVPLIIEDYTPNLPGRDRLLDSAAALNRILETM